MSEATEPTIQECATCGALIDVSDEEPLALIHCPTCGAAARVRKMFGQFELLEVLGAGGMGAVYRAHDTNLNRSVALKLLRHEYSDHPEVTKQFEHEAALTALINHANVVKVYSTGIDHGLFYIAMELVDKGSLDDLMTLQGRVGEAQALEVGMQVAQGLRAAFQRGLMHRDVKPGNVLFADAHHSKIVDFGLAAPINSSSEVGGEVWGTPYYVAPEKLETPPQEDFRSDIYSLGATLFHAIAGRPPFEAEDASMVALKHLKSQAVSLQSFAPDVSSSTAYVINKMLSKDPDGRYASYDEVIQHLEYARNQLLTKTAVPVKVRASKKQTRVVMESTGFQGAMSFITIIMLGALGFAGYYLYQHSEIFFPKQEARHESSTDKQRKAMEKLKPRFDEARHLMVIGKYAESAEAMHKLEAEPDMPQPLLDWITLHAGLSQVFAGKLDDSHTDFAKLSKRGSWDSDPFNQAFAQFMTKISDMMVTDDPIPADKAADYKKDNYEAIAPLLFGLKDWELGEFESALSWLREFQSVKPAYPDGFIAEYAELTPKYADSFAKYNAFAEEVKSVGEPEKAKVALPQLKEKLASLGLLGELNKKGHTQLRKVEQEVAEYDAERKRELDEMEETDAKAIADAKEKGDPLAKQFKFKEAYAIAKGAQMISDKGKADKKALMKRYDWLAGFKSQLTQDIGAAPYPSGVIRKVGLAVPGPVTDATDTDLVVKVGASEVKVPWTDASFEGLYNIAISYLRPDLPADRLADRLWFLGVFAEFSGKVEPAAVLFGKAVKSKPEYEEEWKIFPDVPKPAEEK